MVSHHRIADVAPVISQSIHERVTRHHAHIGAAVPAHALQQLEEQLASEAGRHYVLGEFEKALDTYCHTLAVVEKARRPGSLSAMRHNIAACLHQLGDVEAAREYYELALNGFESRAAATPKIEAILFGKMVFGHGVEVSVLWVGKPSGLGVINGILLAKLAAVRFEKDVLETHWKRCNPKDLLDLLLV